jgi:hypothetical protein
VHFIEPLCREREQLQMVRPMSSQPRLKALVNCANGRQDDSPSAFRDPVAGFDEQVDALSEGQVPNK